MTKFHLSKRWSQKVVPPSKKVAQKVEPKRWSQKGSVKSSVK